MRSPAQVVFVPPGIPFFTYLSSDVEDVQRIAQPRMRTIRDAQGRTPTASSTSSSDPTAPVTNAPNSAKRDEASS